MYVTSIEEVKECHFRLLGIHKKDKKSSICNVEGLQLTSYIWHEYRLGDMTLHFPKFSAWMHGAA